MSTIMSVLLLHLEYLLVLFPCCGRGLSKMLKRMINPYTIKANYFNVFPSRMMLTTVF